MNNFNKFITLLFISFLSIFLSYTQPYDGVWRSTLAMQGMQLPFHIEMQEDGKKWKVWIRNGKERMLMRDAVVTDDSLYLPMNLFDSYIKAKIEGDNMHGVFVKRYYDNYSLPFKAEYGLEYRFFPDDDVSARDYSGKWEIKFTSDSLPSIGIFEQQGSKITGTIITITGDYRFLDGDVKGNTIYLSTFDGSHEFIFQASEMQKGKLVGLFLFGKTYKEGWTATKNPNITLPNPTELGQPNTDTTFQLIVPNLLGKAIDLESDKYEGKPIILQIFGTWCSNSMDLSNYIDQWLQSHQHLGFEWVAVGFETSEDVNYGQSRLLNWRSFQASSVTTALGGKANKVEAAALFPILKSINAFPTLIVLDSQHQLVRTYGYFTGPATGEYFERFKQDFEEVMKSILDKKK